MRRVSRPPATENDAPADHQATDPAQPAADPSPVTPPELTEEAAAPQPDRTSPVVFQNCPRKSRSLRTNSTRSTNNTTVRAVTTELTAGPMAPIRRRYVDVPISVSTPDLLPALHQAAVPVQQLELAPAASLPQSTAMVRPVQHHSVAAGSKHSGCPSAVDSQAPAAQGTGVPRNSRTPPVAAGDSTLAREIVGVTPEPNVPLHPQPPRPHVVRAGFTVTVRMPLGASMQPDSLEPTQSPPAALVHQPIAVDTVRRTDSVAFETLNVPDSAHSQDSNDERPQLEVSTRPQAEVERNVGLIPASTMSNLPLHYRHDAVVPVQPANASLPVFSAAPQAFEAQITLPAARRPPIDEYSLHQSIAGTVRRPSAALRISIPLRHAQNLNVERPQRESLTRLQPVVGTNVGDDNPTSMANTQIAAPSHVALPSQPPNSSHHSLLPASTTPQPAGSGMPSSSIAPPRRQPIKVKRHPRPLAPKCRAGGGSRVHPSSPPSHSRPPAVSTQLEASTSPRDGQTNVGGAPLSTHITPLPPASRTASLVQVPEPIVAPFRPYARQTTPHPVQHAYSSVQQPAPFGASVSGRQIPSPRPFPPVEYISEWQPMHPPMDQTAGGIHRQGYIVPGQSVVPHAGTIPPEMVTAPGDLSYNNGGQRAVHEFAAAVVSCDGGIAHHDKWFFNFQPLQAHYNSWRPSPMYTQATRPTPMRLLVPPSEEFNGNWGHHHTVRREMMGIPLQAAPTSGFQPYAMSRFIPPADVRPSQFSVMAWGSVEEIHATTSGLSFSLNPGQTLIPRAEETPVNLQQNTLPITEMQPADPTFAGDTRKAEEDVDIATADRLTWLSL